MRERLNWIDWLKVIVVVGAFVFHAAQPFVVTTWLVMDPDKNLALSVLSGFGYMVGMPLMFFLAGAATWLAVQRRGIGGHTGLRLQRLIAPLVLGLVILGPPQAWVAYLAAGGQAGVLEFLGMYLRDLRFYPHPTWFGEYGHHLWFLAFLFLYVLLTLPLLSWLRARRAAGRDLRIGAIAAGPGGLVWFLVPLAVNQLILRPLFPGYRDWADFALWLSYFVIGILAMAEARLMEAILHRRRAIAWMAPLVAIGYLPFVVLGSPIELEHAPGLSAGGLAYVGWRTTLGFVMTLIVVGVAATYFTARPRLLAWASHMVLPFYVLHHPVTVVVAAIVVGLSAGVWVKFGLILLLAGATTLALCVVLDMAGKALRGRRSRGQPASAMQGEAQHAEVPS